MATWLDRLTKRSMKAQKRDNSITSMLRQMITGSFYKVSDLRGTSSLADIRTQIDTMRALARDSQIATALAYYATDATTVNSAGQIIWATAKEDKFQQAADIVNAKLTQWSINSYARDHILELATIGNLYLPTTVMYRDAPEGQSSRHLISLDHNSIVDDSYEVVASYKIPPENVVHLWS